MLKQEEQVNPPADVEPNEIPASPPPAVVNTDHNPPSEARSRADRGVNDRYIQQVLEVERQADDLHNRAVSEAEQLPAEAQKEGQEMIERSRVEAQEEARRILAGSKAQEESARIISQAEDKMRRMKTSASGRMDMAVHYILDQIAGKE